MRSTVRRGFHCVMARCRVVGPTREATAVADCAGRRGTGCLSLILVAVLIEVVLVGIDSHRFEVLATHVA